VKEAEKCIALQCFFYSYITRNLLPKELFQLQSNDDIHFIYFLHNKKYPLHRIHVDRQIFRYTAYKILHCLPSASPAHENRKHGSMLFYFTYFITEISAK
jgi:hypothetical protein